jgi:hypothetical protein
MLSACRGTKDSVRQHRDDGRRATSLDPFRFLLITVGELRIAALYDGCQAAVADRLKRRTGIALARTWARS